jgi:hypothetical protein
LETGLAAEILPANAALHKTTGKAIAVAYDLYQTNSTGPAAEFHTAPDVVQAAANAIRSFDTARPDSLSCKTLIARLRARSGNPFLRTWPPFVAHYSLI